MKKFHLLLSILLTACMTAPDRDGRTTTQCVDELFFGSHKGDIAEISLGDPQGVVMEQRIGRPLYEDNLEVIDSVVLCSEKKGYAEWSIRFVNGRVGEMELNLFLSHEEDIVPVMDHLKMEMDRRHDSGMKQQGIWFWQRKRDRFLDQIYLLDASDRYKKPVVQMLLSDGEGVAA
jgi:hypothetical protein